MAEYLVKVRNGDIKDMGYTPAGLYGGAFLGRLVLAEPTHRLCERPMVFIYAVLCVGLQLVFWLYVSFTFEMENIITETVAVNLLVSFQDHSSQLHDLNDLSDFPSQLTIISQGISVGSKIFSPEFCSSAIGETPTHSPAWLY